MEKSYDSKLIASKPRSNTLSRSEVKKLKENIVKRLDKLEFSSFHLMVISALGVSWVLDGYEVSLLSVLSGIIENSFSMNDTEIGLASSLYLIGCVSGSLFFGLLAAKWGRRALFSITLGLYILSIIFTAFSVNKYMLFIFRFFTGVAVGGEYSSIFAAIDELIPASVRGRADLIIDGTWHFGSCMASLLSYLFLTVMPNYQELVLRGLFLIGVILAFPVIYLRKYIPESPRWLLYKGRYKEAITTVESIETKCHCTGTEENINLLNNNINVSSKEIENENTEEISFKEIFTILFKKHRTRFLYGLTLMASQAFFYNGIFYTYSLILRNFYFISKETVGLYMIPLSVASFLGPVVLGKYFDTWSRRGMIALTFSTSGFLLILTAINFISGVFGFVTQQVLWFITFFIASPAASSAHLTVSEIFPLEMRSQAMAIFFSMGLGTGGVIAPFFFGLLINSNNKTSIFYSYLVAAFIMIFAGVIGLLYGVDAENKSLEEISKDIRDDDSELNENN
jgi:MFS family permease